MARVKKSARHVRREQQRVTWTRFRLDPGHSPWPSWSANDAHSDLGPLASVEGCLKVKLGRQVESPEKAAIIIHWSSIETLTAFQNSPAYMEFEHCLALEDSPEEPMRHLRLADDGVSPTTEPAPSASLQWRYNDVGFDTNIGPFENDELHGRVTLTILTIPYTSTPDYESWQSTIAGALRFLPKGCEDLKWHPGKAHDAYYSSFLWVDYNGQTSFRGRGRGYGGGESHQEAEVSRATCHVFHRWNDNPDRPAREEVNSRDPQAKELWLKHISMAMPPVASWVQERWDIEVAPYYLEANTIRITEYEEDDETDAEASG